MTRLLATLACLLTGVAAAVSPFDTPEPVVVASASKPARYELAAGEQVLATAVSPLGPDVAVAVRAPDGGSWVALWTVGKARPSMAWKAPAGVSVEAVAWHPGGGKVFALTRQGSRSGISLLTPPGEGDLLERSELYSSDRELKGLVVSPRPFLFSDGKKEVRGYRLFFGVRYAGGYALRTLTELGTREYLVIGPASEKLEPRDMDEYDVPEPLNLPSALPVAVHPNGQRLLFTEAKGSARIADYSPPWELREKSSSAPATAVAFLPNGLGLLLWEPGKPGARVQLSLEKKPRPIVEGQRFLAPPALTVDGKGLVGVVGGERPAVVFEPVSIPLGDVSNGWLAVKSKAELEKLGRHAGAFVPGRYTQLYHLYEEELYREETSEAVPYLVTTDGFWELFAAAYEGSFILAERYQAMPRFWDFVREANQDGKKLAEGWDVVFAALESLRAEPAPKHPEAQRIIAAKGPERSQALNGNFDFGELKPRGHYTASDDLKRYFQAMRYLTYVSRGLDTKLLGRLPPRTQDLARAWIAAYDGYIAPARAPLIWSKEAFAPPPYLRAPSSTAMVFPLSWGFDNEVMLTDVFHCETPLPERMQGPVPPGMKVDPELLFVAERCLEKAPEPRVPRLLPTGLDVAAAMGSQRARELMASELEQFPPLGRALDELGARFKKYTAAQASTSLYDRWLRALALQWAEDVAPPKGVDAKLWKAKRLQTGLGSWATLRHATVLVNERVAAELGSGGEFERVWPEQPRGFVEPDPKTFEAIAQLFEGTAEAFRRASASLGNRQFTSDVGEEREAVVEGVLKRLTSSAQAARAFKAMAEKQLRGEALTSTEYEQILYVGRNFEHTYLIFKSLGDPKLALSEPKPISKIADVADGGPKPLLHVAVGKPLEWKLVVPHLGRRQIVRGAVYSYYEVIQDEPISDEEWQAMEARTPRPTWIAPFIAWP
ncbi:DUF3160 domain-containing protein [Hyalangium gracile]|uniref:DUF3160 domain-containing protein n=1 Tax=Hyalangium gracile TaxID=394092 RepID=UPI001CCA019F|nr:DUF3160 domain-containing protein [Hyalangium gracile]